MVVRSTYFLYRVDGVPVLRSSTTLE